MILYVITVGVGLILVVFSVMIFDHLTNANLRRLNENLHKLDETHDGELYRPKLPVYVRFARRSMFWRADAVTYRDYSSTYGY